MILCDAAIEKRTPVMVLALVITIVGIACYRALPREASPDITIPFVFVSTTYRGVSSPDMETAVTIPIEKKLTGIAGMKKITSVSAEGTSSISIEFVTGTDIDTALQRVKDKVDEAKNDLPTDLEDDPLVFEVNFSDQPITVYAMSGIDDPARLKETADDLADAIETVPGVLEAEVSGGLEREIRVEPIPERLTYFGLTTTALERALRNENQDVSGGAVHLADGRYLVQTPGEFTTPADSLYLVVGHDAGGPIFLKDVAKVTDGHKDATSRSRVNGRAAVTIQVKKRSGENIIAVSKAVEAAIARLRPTWPAGTRIIKLMDKSRDIHNMVSDLENNLVTGLVLVLVVLPWALGIADAVLVALSIPLSMCLSFAVLSAMGITLNMVVLYSLTLALGMLVDNAIVIVENICRFTAQGVPRATAAKRAAGEVAWPVIGSTITTLAAFFPMLYWPGIMGEFMKFLPITLIVTLSASLFTALVITPALASLPRPGETSRQRASIYNDSGGDLEEEPAPVRGRVLSTYHHLLAACLRRRGLVLTYAFALLALVFAFWMARVGSERPVEFFPAIDPVAAYVNFEMPEGADLDYCDRLIRQVEMAIAGAKPAPGGYLDPQGYQTAVRRKTHTTSRGKEFSSISDLPTVRHLFSRAVTGADTGNDIFARTTANHVGIRFLDFKDRPKPSAADLAVIRRRLALIPGADITVRQAKEGPPTGAAVKIEISGPNLRVLGEIAAQVRARAATVPFIEGLRDDYLAATPTIRLVIDKQKAALTGLSAAGIGRVIKDAFNGTQVSTYHEEGEEYDITLQLPYQYRDNTRILDTLLIPTGHGPVPLSTIARLEVTSDIGRIVRINSRRVVTVSAEVDETRLPAAAARSLVGEAIADLHLPPGYSLRFTGEQEDQQESQQFLEKAFAMALLLVGLVLVTQFNSVVQPLIIMTSVVLSLGGAFLGLALFKMSFGIIMTGVGVISLAGVVVNNAIVLIDYANRLTARGYSPVEAALAAGRTRLRPVLLTAITTILGLIPMVTGVAFDFHTMTMSWASESSQWWRSMAMAVIFGLLVATLLTLIVVPVLYSLLPSSRKNESKKL